MLFLPFLSFPLYFSLFLTLKLKARISLTENLKQRLGQKCYGTIPSALCFATLSPFHATPLGIWKNGKTLLVISLHSETSTEV